MWILNLYLRCIIFVWFHHLHQNSPDEFFKSQIFQTFGLKLTTQIEISKRILLKIYTFCLCCYCKTLFTHHFLFQIFIIKGPFTLNNKSNRIWPNSYCVDRHFYWTLEIFKQWFSHKILYFGAFVHIKQIIFACLRFWATCGKN